MVLAMTEPLLLPEKHADHIRKRIIEIHEPLRLQITMNYNIDGFSKGESKEYILIKLRGVHCSRQVFDENVLEALSNAANGVPRLLNKLANSCLLIASSKNCDTVDS